MLHNATKRVFHARESGTGKIDPHLFGALVVRDEHEALVLKIFKIFTGLTIKQDTRDEC